MADIKTQAEQAIQSAQSIQQTEATAVREFINVDTAQNSQLNKGEHENIYAPKIKK